MFKISVVETHRQRRLVLEGRLADPCIAELESAWQNAGEELGGRRLIIDLTNVTFVSGSGENALSKLIRDGAKFSSADVFTKHLLKQLARRTRCMP
jgi:anti-anti-sigma regulatory factor